MTSNAQEIDPFPPGTFFDNLLILLNYEYNIFWGNKNWWASVLPYLWGKEKAEVSLLNASKYLGDALLKLFRMSRGIWWNLFSKYLRLHLGIGRNSPISVRRFIFFPFPFSESYIEIFAENYTEVFDNYRRLLLDVDANLSNDIL